MEKPLVTIICPVFNEEKTVPLFYGRLSQVFTHLETEYRCHLLFVDNCSSDRTLQLVQDLRKNDPRVFHLGLSINVGYQKSVECALRNAVGDFFAVVDVWDALSSDRPYRKGMPSKEVVEYLQKEAGHLFDPHIVDVFISLIANSQ